MVDGEHVADPEQRAEEEECAEDLTKRGPLLVLHVLELGEQDVDDGQQEEGVHLGGGENDGKIRTVLRIVFT